MPVTFLKNNKGIFKNVNAQTGISDKIGWWSSLVAADFDNDGDTDYIAGKWNGDTFKGNGFERHHGTLI